MITLARQIEYAEQHYARFTKFVQPGKERRRSIGTWI
jgi:hypothetical protein